MQLPHDPERLISLAADACAFFFIWRRGLRKDFPFFSAYIAYSIPAAIFLWIVEPHARLYFYGYWSSDAVDVLLAILAIYECFMRVFRGFSRARWFKWLFPATILLALIYAGWGTYRHPPVGLHLSSSILLVSGIVEVRYVVACICILFFLLVLLFRTRWKLPEFGIVLGFGMEAVTFGIAAVVRSEFGTKHAFWSEQLPGLGFLAAQGIWLWALVRAESSLAKAIPLTPSAEMINGLQEQVQVLKKFIGKSQGNAPGD